MIISASSLQRLSLLLVIVIWHAGAVELQAGVLYWTVPDGIQSAGTDGSNVSNVVTGLTGAIPIGIAVDSGNGHVYWTEMGESDIHRVNLDGSNQVTLVDKSLFSFRGLDLDLLNSPNRMYWAEANTVSRAELDGTSQQIVAITGPNGVAVDPGNSHVYWTQGTQIRRADYDGSNETTITTNPVSAFALALDLANSHLYWTDPGADAIRRSDLNGTNVADLVTGLNAADANGIVLDVANDQMFWVNATASGGNIFRSTLSGANQQSIVALSTDANFIALDSSAVPEPSSFLLGLIACAALGICRFANCSWQRRCRVRFS